MRINMEFKMFIFCVVFTLFVHNISCANVYRSDSVIPLEYDSSQLLPSYIDTLNDPKSSNIIEKHKSRRRVRRSLLTSGKCAIGFAWCVVRCCTCDEYVEITGRSC